MKEEKEIKEKYDYLAYHYHNMRTKDNPHGWFYNEFLEMPSVLDLLGNIKNKKLLDLGCGTGIYAKILTKKGAKVKGLDISKEMIKIAKEENPKLDLRVGSGYKIPFNDKFDIILASLVMHYFSDWDKVLKQINKRLKKGGYFVFSTGNPVSECFEKVIIKGEVKRVMGDYFTEKKRTAIWKDIKDPKGKKKNLEMFSFHITYETLINRLLRNGFEIVGYKDCKPDKKAKKYFPKKYEIGSKIPYFTAWKVRKK